MSEIALYKKSILSASDDIKQVYFNNQLMNRYLIANVDITDTTIKGYKVCIRQFLKWLKDNQINQPTRDDIKAYKLYLKNSNYTNGTKNQYIRAVKHLFKWLNSEGLYPNIADNIKGFKVIADNTKKDAFTEQEIKKIIDDIDTSSVIGKRDKAIILLMLVGGLRITEIHNMDIQDIEIKNNEYIINIMGKGHTEKDNYIKVIKPIYDVLKDYLDTRPNKRGIDPLFTSTSNRALNKRITKETLSQIIKSRFRDSGFNSKKLTAHSIRHTTATLLLKSGADIYKTQHHLRHQDPKTTEIYINMNNKEQDTSELDIYNQVFNKTKQSNLKDLRDSINDLSDADVIEVLNYINTKNGGKKNG